LRRVFLYRCAARPLDLTPAQQRSDGYAKAKQYPGNAEHGDRQQRKIIFQKVASADASEKPNNDGRNDE